MLQQAAKLLLVSSLVVSALFAQQPQQQLGGQQTAIPPLPPSPQVQAEGVRPTYVLGPSDQILIRAAEMEDLNERPFRVDEDGYISLPQIGRLLVGGLTVAQLEQELLNRLKNFVRNPQVYVSVVQYRSDPVFVVGAFARPGIYPLQGKRGLLELLSSVGGILPGASRRVRITRRMDYGKIPLPSAIEDKDTNTSSVEIGLGSLRNNVSPKEDIELKPFDIISVERSELVYMSGAFGRNGPLDLSERESLSMLQALSLSGGLTPNANRKKLVLLRPVLNTTRRAEIPLDIDKIQRGQANDFPLMANDVIYVPVSNRTALLGRTAWIAATILPGIIFSLIR
jgi:polysaccharide biosynthesis/export protein